jgi:predicted alpha/beta-hydrolase family hydrolase
LGVNKEVIGLSDTTSHAVSCGGDSTSVALDRAARPLGVTFVFAPGAGAHREHPSVLGLSQALCSRGIDVARFNFWYREQGKATPDRMSRLLACYESVAAFAKTLLPGNRLVIGRALHGRAGCIDAGGK